MTTYVRAGKTLTRASTAHKPKGHPWVLRDRAKYKARLSQTPGAIATRARRKQARCPHHWIIPEPNGPESVGVCKLCAKRRTFYNSEEAQRGNAANSWRVTSKKKKRRLPEGFHVVSGAQ